MYKHITTFLFVSLICIQGLFAQMEKMNFQLQKKLSSHQNDSKEISLFVEGDETKIRTAVAALGGTYKYAAGNISAVRLPVNKVAELGRVAEIKRITSNDLKLQPMNDQMIRNNHAYEVHSGFNLPQGYTGQGVVMGIIDEGIDFTHPDFRDAFNQTRIKYLWDQAILVTNSSISPQPYNYGKEYVGSQIDTATETHDSQFSHGSHVAGIAAGNGRAMNNYTGVAPESDLIIVKMNLDRPQDEFLSNLVDAVKYIFDHADAMGKPAVINISLGTYFGSHDGKDVQAQAIDNLITSGPGHIVVCSAGNAGNAPIHLGYTASADTNFTWLQPSGNPLYIQGWCDSADFATMQISAGADRERNGYSEVGRLPFRNSASLQNIITVDTIYNNNLIRVAIVTGLIQNWGDRFSFEYEIEPDSSMRVSGNDTINYLYKLMITGGGRFDAWSYDMVFDNLPSTVSYPSIAYYKKPDTDQTIVSSFTCSDKVITVGSSVNRNRYTNVNFLMTEDQSLVPGALSSFSSRGPTRDGRIKPEIVATGEWVLSAASQNELDLLAAVEPAKVAAGKKHKRSSGTSMASPVVAGIAALYLQKNPQADWQEVKNKIIGCADRDNATGFALPDNDWGYGKINGYSVVKGCNVGVEDVNYNFVFEPYPNPASDMISFEYDLSHVRHRSAEIVISNIIGQSASRMTIDEVTSSATSPSLEPGVYMASLMIDKKVVSIRRFVIL